MGSVKGKKSNIKTPEHTAAQAVLLPMNSGQLIYVTTTSATFTSTGNWMCENGGWVKM